MKFQVKKLVYTAFFLALGLVLPSVFHVFGIGAGMTLLPMHIPVLLCGFICGWQYGAICGLVVPLLSSVVTGMPPLYPIGISMALELAAYGLVSGLLYRKMKLYPALLGAMLGGRLVGGLANLVLLGFAGKPYSWQIFMTANFVTALPGIILQLIVIPALVVALTRAGLAVKPQRGC